MEVDQNVNLNTNMDAARSFQNALNDAPLRIVADRDRFKSHKLEGGEEAADETLRDPEFVANDVAAQIVSGFLISQLLTLTRRNASSF